MPKAHPAPEVAGTSKGNTQMCSLVLNYIKSFLESHPEVTLDKIVVIVTYLQQRELYPAVAASDPFWKNLNVATADTFQKHERTFAFLTRHPQKIRMAMLALLTTPTDLQSLPLVIDAAFSSSKIRDASIPSLTRISKQEIKIATRMLMNTKRLVNSRSTPK
jgi:hypothetical protein